MIPIIGSSQNYYNVFFMMKNDTMLRAIICTKTIDEAKVFAAEMAKDYKCTYKLSYLKRRPKTDDKINYLIWK